MTRAEIVQAAQRRLNDPNLEHVIKYAPELHRMLGLSDAWIKLTDPARVFGNQHKRRRDKQVVNVHVHIHQR
jgi:hypothetical protein